MNLEMRPRPPEAPRGMTMAEQEDREKRIAKAKPGAFVMEVQTFLDPRTPRELKTEAERNILKFLPDQSTRQLFLAKVKQYVENENPLNKEGVLAYLDQLASGYEPLEGKRSTKRAA